MYFWRYSDDNYANTVDDDFLFVLSLIPLIGDTKIVRYECLISDSLGMVDIARSIEYKRLLCV